MCCVKFGDVCSMNTSHAAITYFEQFGHWGNCRQCFDLKINLQEVWSLKSIRCTFWLLLGWVRRRHVRQKYWTKLKKHHLWHQLQSATRTAAEIIGWHVIDESQRRQCAAGFEVTVWRHGDRPWSCSAQYFRQTWRRRSQPSSNQNVHLLLLRLQTSCKLILRSKHCLQLPHGRIITNYVIAAWEVFIEQKSPNFAQHIDCMTAHRKYHLKFRFSSNL